MRFSKEVVDAQLEELVRNQRLNNEYNGLLWLEKIQEEEPELASIFSRLTNNTVELLGIGVDKETISRAILTVTSFVAQLYERQESIEELER